MKSSLFKKPTAVILAIVMCVAALFCLTACRLPDDSTEDTRGANIKPNLGKVYDDYSRQDIKGSDLDISVTVSLFSQNATSSVGQKLNLSRNDDGERYYAEGELKTDVVGNNGDAVVNLVCMLLENNPDTNELRNYLKGKGKIKFGIGEKKDYNIKLEMTSDDSYKVKRYAVADDAIRDAADGKADGFKLHKWLASEGMLNLGSASEWMDKDEANKFFNTSENKYIYQISANVDKVKSKLVKKAKAVIKEFLVSEEFSAETFETVADYVESWISVKPTSLKVLAGENGLPDKAEINCEVDIDIPLHELKDVLFLTGGEEGKKLGNKIQNLATIMKLTDTKHNSDAIGFKVGYSSVENFRYGSKQCGFNGVDATMFADVEEDIPGRVVITAETILEVFNKFFGDKTADSEE